MLHWIALCTMWNLILVAYTEVTNSWVSPAKVCAPSSFPKLLRIGSMMLSEQNNHRKNIGIMEQLCNAQFLSRFTWCTRINRFVDSWSMILRAWWCFVSRLWIVAFLNLMKVKWNRRTLMRKMPPVQSFARAGQQVVGNWLRKVHRLLLTSTSIRKHTSFMINIKTFGRWTVM